MLMKEESAGEMVDEGEEEVKLCWEEVKEDEEEVDTVTEEADVGLWEKFKEGKVKEVRNGIDEDEEGWTEVK